MAGDHGLSDLRFAGMDNGALADQIDKLAQGTGSDGFHRAALALKDLAKSLSDTDKTLRDELAKLGVEWEGQAADGGTQATQSATIYAADATQPTEQTSGGVTSQGETYSTTVNSAPSTGELRGPTKQNGVDRFLGALGHTTDHARQVQQTNEARGQAIDAMNNYQSGSQSAIGQASTLPVPPVLSTGTQAAGTGTGMGSVGGYQGSGGYTPGNAGGPGGVSTAPGVGGGGSVSAVPGVGGGAGGGAPQFGGGGGGGAPALGGGQPAQGSLPPGSRSGVGPLFAPGGGPVIEEALAGGSRAAISAAMMNEAALAAGMVGAGGAGAVAGDLAEKDRLTRGRQGVAAGQPGGDEHENARRTNPIAAEPEEEGRAARSAERLAGAKGRPSSSLLQPAAPGASAPGEDDREHVRRYGVDSTDLFEDDREVVVDTVGLDPDPNQR